MERDQQLPRQIEIAGVRGAKVSVRQSAIAGPASAAIIIGQTERRIGMTFTPAFALETPRGVRRCFSSAASSGKRSSAPSSFGPVHLQERRSRPLISNKNGEGFERSP